jgi:hypothetical protein
VTTPRKQLIEAISNACRENVKLRFGENAIKVMESGGRLGLSGGEADEIGRCALQALSDLGAVVLMPVKAKELAPTALHGGRVETWISANAMATTTNGLRQHAPMHDYPIGPEWTTYVEVRRA